MRTPPADSARQLLHGERSRSLRVRIPRLVRTKSTELQWNVVPTMNTDHELW